MEIFDILQSIDFIEIDGLDVEIKGFFSNGFKNRYKIVKSKDFLGSVYKISIDEKYDLNLKQIIDEFFKFISYKNRFMIENEKNLIDIFSFTENYSGFHINISFKKSNIDLNIEKNHKKRFKTVEFAIINDDLDSIKKLFNITSIEKTDENILNSLNKNIYNSISNLNEIKQSVFHLSIKHSSKKLFNFFITKSFFKTILNKKDIYGKTAAHYASIYSQLYFLKKIKSSGGDLNIKDSQGNSPLHYATLNSNLDIVEYLINKKVKITKNRVGETPLHFASYSGSLDIVKLLLSYQNRVDIKDKDGYTPLHYAIQERHEKIVSYLLESGADINIKDSQGVSAKEKLDFDNDIDE
ncbi:ankyrin repeat domain-containing protein [bacterium]|nr:ankyrin repeat domain-containing protein [bacterium]